MCLEALYNRYAGYMWQIAQGILNNASSAEDTVHEAFIKIMENMSLFTFDIDSVETKGLIAAITRNTAINRYKRDRYFDWLAEDAIDLHASEAGTEEMYLSKEAFEKVKSLIKELPVTCADTLLLTCFYGYPEKETAQILGISYEATRQRVSRAKRLLKQRMKDEVTSTHG